MHGELGYLPFTRLRVVLRSGETMPLVVVELWMIGTIVVTRPPRLLPEERVPGHRLGCQDPVLELPCPLELS